MSTTMSAWRVGGASVQGTSHRTGDIPCQDSHAFRSCEDGVLLIAIADGAGSARHSALGSRAAVDSALDALSRDLQLIRTGGDSWPQLVRGAFEAALDAVRVEAETLGVPPQSMASTLTCVVATPEHLAIGQIGDGIVVAEFDAGRFEIVMPAQHGEYAGETNFLTMRGALDLVEIREYPRTAHSVVAMTDGVIKTAINLATETPFPGFFRPLISYLTSSTASAAFGDQLSRFLDSPRVNDISDDDKTLVIATRVTVQPEGRGPGVDAGERPADASAPPEREAGARLVESPASEPGRPPTMIRGAPTRRMTTLAVSGWLLAIVLGAILFQSSYHRGCGIDPWCAPSPRLVTPVATPAPTLTATAVPTGSPSPGTTPTPSGQPGTPTATGSGGVPSGYGDSQGSEGIHAGAGWAP